jgi:zinc transport system permease protein
MENFIVNALIAGVGIAAIAGPLGCFVVWRRMAYFGDSLSHSALLGISLGVLLGINLNIGIIFTCLIFAIFLYSLERRKKFPSDTSLSIIAHGSLSVGIIVASLTPKIQNNLLGFLFGDILSVTSTEIIWIYASLSFVFAALYFIWKPLLLSTINEDIAKAEGVKTNLMQIIFIVMIAVLISASIRIVGVMLITSLLVIPAAAARVISKSPKQMALIASIFGIFSVIFGVISSYYIDIPTGPAIVVCSIVIFILSNLVGRK